MKTLLLVQMALYAVGITAAIIGFTRRDRTREFLTWRFERGPWLWSKQFRDRFLDARAYLTFVTGIGLIMLGGLFGSIYFFSKG